MSMKPTTTNIAHTIIAIALSLGLSACSSFDGAACNNNDYAASYYTPTQQRPSSDVQNQISNCDNEITLVQRRLQDLESNIDSIREDTPEDTTNTITTLEERLAQLETNFHTLKNHANDASNALNQYQQHLSHLEKTDTSHDHNIKNLETALRSLMEAVQDGINTPTDSVAATNTNTSNTYKVHLGDTLGSIAHKNNTTTQALIELNNIQREDLIYAGQTLIIPQ